VLDARSWKVQVDWIALEWWVKVEDQVNVERIDWPGVVGGGVDGSCTGLGYSGEVRRFVG